MHTIIKDIEEKFVNLQEIIQKQAETIYNLEESSFLVKKDVLKTYSKNFKFSEAKNIICSRIHNNMDIIYKDKTLFDIKDKNNLSVVPDTALMWGEQTLPHNIDLVNYAYDLKIPLFIIENSFIRSAYCWDGGTVKKEYSSGISFIIDSVQYFDATEASEMEKTLSNPDFKLSDEEKKRARACIDKIVKTHLTKYNHQPIFEPKIGRNGVKKILVIDQAYRDMSIQKGLANDETFERMLQAAIDENPNADIIVKTHPDAIQGSRKGYYQHLIPHDNVYTLTEPINPISLIKYCDKVYVCSSQFGFEALMCNKEVHVFGMPFYAGWGLTKDRQVCKRRNVRRTLEEVFYAAYIIHSIWVNPDKKEQCEIEEAIDYVLRLRDEYFEEKAQEQQKLQALMQKISDCIENQKEKTVLWGASLFLEDFLSKFEIKNPNIIGIIDKNILKQGKSLNGLKIYSPEEIPEIKVKNVLLTVQKRNKEIHESLSELLQKDFPEVELLPNIFKD